MERRRISHSKKYQTNQLEILNIALKRDRIIKLCLLWYSERFELYSIYRGELNIFASSGHLYIHNYV